MINIKMKEIFIIKGGSLDESVQVTFQMLTSKEKENRGGPIPFENDRDVL